MLKNKKGITTLLQEELIKLIIVVFLATILLWFIYASANGEISQTITKSREAAIWMDAAYNSEFDSQVLIYFPKGILIEKNKIEARISNKAAHSYRTIPSEYKRIVSQNEVAGNLEVEVV